MRMWMVDPGVLCQQHLLGEHVEIHMLVGSLRRGRSIQGFLDRGLLEPSAIYTRHAALTLEMSRRGLRHRSELLAVDVTQYSTGLVDRAESLRALASRCSVCCGRIGQVRGAP
jgi:hypothetical protein